MRKSGQEELMEMVEIFSPTQTGRGPGRSSLGFQDLLALAILMEAMIIQTRNKFLDTIPTSKELIDCKALACLITNYNICMLAKKPQMKATAW